MQCFDHNFFYRIIQLKTFSFGFFSAALCCWPSHFYFCWKFFSSAHACRVCEYACGHEREGQGGVAWKLWVQIPYSATRLLHLLHLPYIYIRFMRNAVTPHPTTATIPSSLSRRYWPTLSMYTSSTYTYNHLCCAAIRWQTRYDWAPPLFMCANAPNDEHSNDGNTVHRADKVHADKEVLQHSWKRMHRPTKTAAPLDCSHPCPGSASSISCGDFGTRFLPMHRGKRQQNECGNRFGLLVNWSGSEHNLYSWGAQKNFRAIRYNLAGQQPVRFGRIWMGELLRFWVVLTCVSVRLRLNARLRRSHTDKYRVVLNLFSSETNCS